MSRSGSTLISKILGVLYPFSASCDLAIASCERVAGQISGQFVKPKNTKCQEPNNSSRVNGRLLWSVRLNDGRSIADGRIVECSGSINLCCNPLYKNRKPLVKAITKKLIARILVARSIIVAF